MANVTFIIGNGFDLQMGMKTRYTDFYEVYTEIQPGDSELIQWFKSTILQDEKNGWVNWADFESGMGKQSVLFTGDNGAVDFLICLDDFTRKFHDYLNKECRKIDWDSITDNINNEFALSLLRFIDKMYISHRDTLLKVVEGFTSPGNTLNFLQFNYTSLFDTLRYKSFNLNYFVASKFVMDLDEIFGLKRIGQNLHIHGSLKDYQIIGVNNIEQILNDEIRDDNEVKQVFVKQNYLNALHHRFFNTPNPSDSAISIIKNSDIICSFGTSIGETDKFWWKIVGDWLKNEEKYLVFFDICGVNGGGVGPRGSYKRKAAMDIKKEEILSIFFELAEYNSGEQSDVKYKIFVELNTRMFNFTLSKKYPFDDEVDPDPPQEEKPSLFVESAF